MKGEKLRRKYQKRLPWRGSAPPGFMEHPIDDDLRSPQLYKLYRERLIDLRSEAKATYMSRREMYLGFSFHFPYSGSCSFEVLGNYSILRGFHDGKWTKNDDADNVAEIKNREILRQINSELSELGVWNWKPIPPGFVGFDGWGSGIALGTSNGIMESSAWTAWPVDLRPNTYETFLRFTELVGPAFGQPELPVAFNKFSELHGRN